MKILSVMTTSSSGGAEFAAVEMLQALHERGNETVLLSDCRGSGATATFHRPDRPRAEALARTWLSLACAGRSSYGGCGARSERRLPSMS